MWATRDVGHESQCFSSWAFRNHNDPKTFPKTILKTIPKRSQNDPKTIPKRSQNDSKHSKRSQNDPKTTPQRPQNNSKNVPKTTPRPCPTSLVTHIPAWRVSQLLFKVVFFDWKVTQQLTLWQGGGQSFWGRTCIFLHFLKLVRPLKIALRCSLSWNYHPPQKVPTAIYSKGND